MSFITSSVSDSVWSRIIKTIPANTEIVVDTFVVARLMGRHYILTAYNMDQNKSKTLCLAVAKENGLPAETIYGKVGKEVIIDVKVSNAGEVKVKNLNAYDIKIEIARLIQGG